MERFLFVKDLTTTKTKNERFEHDPGHDNQQYNASVLFLETPKCIATVTRPIATELPLYFCCGPQLTLFMTSVFNVGDVLEAT